MERALSELVSVACSAGRVRKSRTSQINSTIARQTTTVIPPEVEATFLLDLTFLIRYNIPLAQRPGQGSPGSNAKTKFAGEVEERSQGRGETSGAASNRSGGEQSCAVRYHFEHNHGFP